VPSLTAQLSQGSRQQGARLDRLGDRHASQEEQRDEERHTDGGSDQECEDESDRPCRDERPVIED
jgi:hypothetical protein